MNPLSFWKVFSHRLHDQRDIRYFSKGSIFITQKGHEPVHPQETNYAKCTVKDLRGKEKRAKSCHPF